MSGKTKDKPHRVFSKRTGLGHTLTTMRQRAGMTQHNAAIKIGVAKRTLAAAETNQASTHFHTVVAIAQCYGWDIKFNKVSEGVVT
jgi:DNA-binding XRE family transcriptional regulator